MVIASVGVHAADVEPACHGPGTGEADPTTTTIYDPHPPRMPPPRKLHMTASAYNPHTPLSPPSQSITPVRSSAPCACDVQHMVDREECRCREVLGRWLLHLSTYAHEGHAHRDVAVQPFLRGTTL